MGFASYTSNRRLISVTYKELKDNKKLTKDLNSGFSQEEIKLASNILKCSLFLTIKQRQIKTTLRFCFTSAKMAKMKKSTDNEHWRGCREMGSLIHCWWDCKLVQPLWRSVWRLLRALDVDLPYEPAVPLLGMRSDDGVSYDRGAYLFTLAAALLTVPRKRKLPKQLSTEEIMKRWA